MVMQILWDSFELQWRPEFQEHTSLLSMSETLNAGALARGDAAIFMRFPAKTYREKIWDHCAGAIIIQEAGAIISDAAGEQHSELSHVPWCHEGHTSMSCSLLARNMPSHTSGTCGAQIK